MGELTIGGVDFSEFMGIPYEGSRHPGNVSVDEFLKNPKLGSNCQLLVLGVLKKASFDISGIKMDQDERFGSKELWEDRLWTSEVLDGRHYDSPSIDFNEAISFMLAVQPFNIFFFSPPEEGNIDRTRPLKLKRLHVGICTKSANDLYEEDNTSPPYIFHNPRPGPSCLWTFDDFEDRGYSLFGAKKPVVKISH